METKDLIKNRRLELGLTMAEVARAVGVSEATVSRWESGDILNMRRSKIAALASTLRISPASIVGTKEEDVIRRLDVRPVGPVGRVPVLGKVSAGNGCIAEEEVLYYEATDTEFANGEYFYLVVSGDSMYPAINDGDLVLVKKQSCVDSGALGVCIVDGENGVVKKVIYGEDQIELASFNPYYPPQIFRGNDVELVEIIGRVIESKHRW